MNSFQISTSSGSIPHRNLWLSAKWNRCTHDPMGLFQTTTQTDRIIKTNRGDPILSRRHCELLRGSATNTSSRLSLYPSLVETRKRRSRKREIADCTKGWLDVNFTIVNTSSRLCLYPSLVETRKRRSRKWEIADCTWEWLDANFTIVPSRNVKSSFQTTTSAGRRRILQFSFYFTSKSVTVREIKSIPTHDPMSLFQTTMQADRVIKNNRGDLILAWRHCERLRFSNNTSSRLSLYLLFVETRRRKSRKREIADNARGFPSWRHQP